MLQLLCSRQSSAADCRALMVTFNEQVPPQALLVIDTSWVPGPTLERSKFLLNEPLQVVWVLPSGKVTEKQVGAEAAIETVER